MVGGGIEYAFADQWSLKAEYNFIELGKNSISFKPLADEKVDVNEHMHVVKFGVNYRF